MTISTPWLSIGALIAVLVLVTCLVLFLTGEPLTRDWTLALIAALGVARLT